MGRSQRVFTLVGPWVSYHAACICDDWSTTINGNGRARIRIQFMRYCAVRVDVCVHLTDLLLRYHFALLQKKTLRSEPRLLNHPMKSVRGWKDKFIPFIIHGDAVRTTFRSSNCMCDIQLNRARQLASRDASCLMIGMVSVMPFSSSCRTTNTPLERMTVLGMLVRGVLEEDSGESFVHRDKRYPDTARTGDSSEGPMPD